jgi:tetratricopeptide (TPR) repeat protein
MNVLAGGCVLYVVMRRLAVLLAFGVALIAPLGAQDRALDLRPLLDQYLRGDYDSAVAAASATRDLAPLQLRFVQDTPAWIAADAAHADVRRAAVAAFLVEFAGARYESDGNRFLDLIEWMCVQLRAAGSPTEFERTWHAASHALAGRSRSRTYLLGEYARLPHQKPSTAPPSDPQHPPARHLMHALERFPVDPHFQLSRIVAWTWGRDDEPIRNVRARDDDRPRIIRPAPQLEAVVALEPLTRVPAIAAEAWMRTGLVHLTVRDYASALRAFGTSAPLANDAWLKYLAHFNAGRALEGQSRHESAIDEYRRALEIVPDAESATIALTSLEFARDDREAAVEQINRVFNRKPGVTDPGRLIGYGDFIRWPELRTAMRIALSSYSTEPK